MNDINPRKIKTGGDPRTLTDYATLRDELGKLTHPARPDVNWTYAETLCLNLFEHNGVELQTAAWYTLVRSQRTGLAGMNEGLAILEVLICRLWGSLWPQAVHARVEILSTLARRLQQHLRTQVPGYTDLIALYQAEQHLSAIAEALQRLELRHQTGLDALYQQIRHAAVRLENNSDRTHDAPIPPASQLVYVIHKDPEVRIQVAEAPPAKPKRWPAFIAGMGTALVLSAATVFGWQAIHQPDDATNPMVASVARLPEPMTNAEIEAFRGTDNSRTHSAMWIGRISNQVNWIMNLTPGWRLRLGQGLVSQATALWPDDPATRTLVQRWEQYQMARTLPASELQGWHDGMTQLQALSAKLDALDHQKGKYLTGSELKTMVWQITRSFASAVPVEEQLRLLVTAPGEANAAGANIEQASRHLDSLIHVLEQLSANHIEQPTEKSGQRTP
ncbi:VasL domain-containing protein [Enterobacter vonholyi]